MTVHLIESRVAASREQRAFIFGAALMFFIQAAWIIWDGMQPPPLRDEGIDAVAIASCRLPDTEGSYTWFHMRDGKMECGRYQ